MAPPAIKFDSPCYHPNVDINGGGICLDILQVRDDGHACRWKGNDAGSVGQMVGGLQRADDPSVLAITPWR